MNMNITRKNETVSEKKNSGEKDLKDRRSAIVFVTATGANKECYEKNGHSTYNGF